MNRKSAITAFISLLFIIFTIGRASALPLPEWVENFSIIYSPETGSGRLGLEDYIQQSSMQTFLEVESKIGNRWKVGMGLVRGNKINLSSPPHIQGISGASSVRSLVYSDYTYAKFLPNQYLSFIGANTGSPLVQSMGLLRNEYVSPEGIAAAFRFNPSENVELYMTSAYLMLDGWMHGKSSSGFIAAQPGILWNIDDFSSLELNFTYYSFNNLHNNWLWHVSGINSMDDNWDPRNRYETLVTDLQFSYYLDGIAHNYLSEIIPYVAVYTRWSNSLANRDGRDFLLGMKFGNEIVREAGQWQFMYNWRRFERFGWLDLLRSNEFYRMDLQAKGSEAELKIGLRNNLIFGLDYHYAKPLIPRDTGNEEKEYLLKADFIFKF